METIIAMVIKFFSDVFSDVIKDQLNSIGETYEIENEKGIIEVDVKLDDLLDEFSDI